MNENGVIPILVADDTESTRYTFSRYLRAAGFAVWEATTGREALTQAARRPALVILDVQFPDMLGFEVSRRIKADPATASIPILQTSAAFTSTQDKALGLDNGADGYLTSPLEPEELVATVRALLRVREAEGRARSLSEQWQATFDAITDGICLVDGFGAIQRWNRAFGDLMANCGIDPAGMTFDEALREAGIADSPFPMMRQTAARGLTDTPFGDRYLRITVDPMPTEDGAPGAVCILRDITLQKRSELEVKQAQKQLQEHARDLELRVEERTVELKKTVQSLEEFCYSIAHDLQAPLRSLRTFTRILQDDYGKSFDEAGRNLAGRIVLSAVRMQELVGDLLTYGRMTHTETTCEPLDLSAAIAGVLDFLETEINGRQARITVVPGIPAVVHANRSLLSQVLTNLLENALKFVPADRQPCISIRTEARQSMLRLWIEDNGIGIEPGHAERIFGIFERLHRDETAFTGTGMGLAIVRKATEKMRGTVGVESQPGMGSKFWIELPMAASK